MKVFKYFLFLVLITVIGTIIYIAVQPNSIQIKKTTITLNVPSSIIYNTISDYKKWKTWSPCNKQTVFVKNLESANDSTLIKQFIEFNNFPTSEITWKLKPLNNKKTSVSCEILITQLPLTYKISKILNNNLEQLVTNELKKSLKKLELNILANMQAYSIKINGLTSYCEDYYIYTTSTCKLDQLHIKTEALATKLIKYAKSNNINLTGIPFVICENWDKNSNTITVSYCLPTTEEVIINNNQFLSGKLESINTLKTTLKGDIKNLNEAWKVANKYISDNYIEEHESGKRIITFILESEDSPNPANWITEIYVAVNK